MNTILKADHITKVFGRGDTAVKAIQDITLEIEKGDFTVILGRSGSGKSTLLHVLAGLIRPDTGKVFCGGKSLYNRSDTGLTVFRRRNMGFVFQFFNLISCENVYDNIVLPIHLDGQREDPALVEQIMTELEIRDKQYAWIHELSGGQQQRVAIARALVSKPKIVFADEPTGNLDSKTAEEVILLLRKMQKKYDQTVVMATHDHAIAALADRLLILEDGKIVRDKKKAAAF